MKPPICCICDKELDEDEGGLVYFKKSASDLEWDKKMNEKPGMVGHPPYAKWFCGAHYNKAKELTSFTLKEALKFLKSI